jgi:hypothetical protein
LGCSLVFLTWANLIKLLSVYKWDWKKMSVRQNYIQFGTDLFSSIVLSFNQLHIHFIVKCLVLTRHVVYTDRSCEICQMIWGNFYSSLFWELEPTWSLWIDTASLWSLLPFLCVHRLSNIESGILSGTNINIF